MKRDKDKTKEQLTNEPVSLRQRVVAKLENKIDQLTEEITERKQAEARVEHLNLVLKAIRGVNQLITKEKARDKLLQGACDNLTETRGYFNAWIALLDESGKLVAHAGSGLDKNFLPMVERLKRGQMTICGQRALNQPEVVVTEDPVSTCTDCPLSNSYSGRSGTAVRLEYEGKVYGLLSVSVPSEMATDVEEMGLFREVADDIAFALYNIEMEEKRTQAEAELILKDMVFRQSVSANSISDNAGIITHINDSFIRIWGYESRNEVIGKPISYFLRFEDEAKLIITALDETGEWEGEYTALRKDGTTFNAYGLATIIPDKSGKTIGYQSTVMDITERKQAEEILLESEERFRSVTESADFAIISADSHGNILLWNKTAETIFNYSADEVIGLPLTIIMPERFREAYDNGMHRAVSKGALSTAGKRHEVTGLRKDGSEVPIEISLATWQMRREIFFTGIIVDITERKQAEEEIIKLSKFPSENPNPVLRAGKDGTILYANQASLPLLNMWGCQVGNFLPDYYHKFVLKALSSRSIKNIEVECGKQIFSLLFAPVISRDEVNLYGLDITERKQAEKALRQSEENLRSYLENAPDGVYINNMEGTFLYGNRRAEEIIGYTREELIGQSFLKLNLLPAEYHAKAAEALAFSAIKERRHSYMG